jgi:membrane associated rhomboid family serine protease
MSAAPGSEVTSHCYRHPNREALIRCVRCDRPICPDCMRPASVGFHCPDDVQAGARTVRAPRTSVGAQIIQSPPYVTIVLAALSVAGYLATGLQKPGTLRDPSGSELFVKWQLFPPKVHDGAFYQLLTSGFLHLSPLHIAANMISLAFVGPFLEMQLGRWRFLSVYLLSLLGGSAAVYAFGFKLSATAGASGAIFGLLGIALVLVRKIGLDLQWLVGTLVLNFVITFSVPGISKWGHIGGFVTGVLAGLAMGGLPASRTRVPTRVQLAGLGAVLALLLVVVAVRTATW